MTNIIQASFFWENNKPGGFAISFGPPSFTPEMLASMFEGEHIKSFMRESDLALGTDVVRHYLAQLVLVSYQSQLGQRISVQEGVLVALNIMWLSSRGFIPNDEFNGVRFISQLPVVEPGKAQPS